MLEKLLLEFGLNDKEAKTYLACLELGPSKVQDIAKLSGVGRVNTYYIIDKLIAHGLIARTYKDDVMIFVADEPEALVSIMEKRALDFKKYLPELKAMTKHAKRPSMRLYEGEEGIKALYEDSLTSKEKIMAWNSAENLEAEMPEYFHDYYKRRAMKKIFITGILNDSPEAREYQKQDKELLREIRLVPKDKMGIKPECYIYENKVSFMSLHEKIGVMIESKDIADAMKRLYELAWEKAGEY
jgi:HTH-type transcriptional regulator, sugar sensing transcriptional regulator